MDNRIGQHNKGKQVSHGDSGSGWTWNPVPVEQMSQVYTGPKRSAIQDAGRQSEGSTQTNKKPSNRWYGYPHHQVPHEPQNMDTDSEEDTDEDSYPDVDESQQNYGMGKKARYVQKFFEKLESMTTRQINIPNMQWHCPAYQGGRGESRWYHLQPLISHMRDLKSGRVKLHRKVVKQLEKEIQSRGAYVIPHLQSYGLWKGHEEVEDHEMVWPPMVIVVNTGLDIMDNNDKLIGMGNSELLSYFQGYPAIRARHSYGPQGHRGMSVLIFDSRASGYLAAQTLHSEFIRQHLGRNAFSGGRPLITRGLRQLFGYLATKQDMEDFNRNCQGKSIVKFEMISFQEMVVKDVRQPVHCTTCHCP